MGSVPMHTQWVERTAAAAHPAQALSGSSNEVFTALDTPGAAGPNWVHADARHAEAGYLDPSLGWVAVRAQTAGAAVHASIVPASADAAQALGSHLPALSAYMAQHPTAATQVTMAAPEMGTGAQGSNHQMAGDSGRQPSPQNARADAMDTSGPALRGRTSESNVAIPSISPSAFRSGATISLVA